MSVKVEDFAEEPSKKKPGKDNKKTKHWKKFVKFMLVLQAVASLVALGLVAILKMLPTDYYLCIAIFLLALWFVALILLGTGTKKKDKVALKKKRTAGVVFSALVTLICILVSVVVGKLIATMNQVSSQTTAEETIGVYVRSDDPAESIEDAKDYTFGITDYYEADYKNTVATIDDINDTLGSEITTTTYDSITDMVTALYNGEISAMIMDEAYQDVLADQDDFENIADDTRIIFEHVIETELDNDDAVSDITKDPFIVYISGSDTRSTTLAKSRSDVNILAVVNPTTKEILLVNTPRDYYVTVPMSTTLKDKLTHCGLYGVDCSMETLGNLYGVDVNYYAQINFTGLETLVDAVGGITVESDRAFTSSSKASTDGSKYSFVEGENVLNGKQALAFARERKNLSDGDLGRGIHQMAVIKALISKMTSPAIITGYMDIMDSVADMTATDVSSDDISALVQMQIDDGASWHVSSYAVTGDGQKNYTYSMPNQKSYTMIPDEESVSLAQTLMQKVINGGTITDDDLEGNTTESTETAQ